MIIGVAVKAGELMVALPKPNRHADCINIILSLGLVPDIQNQWGKFYTLSNVANKNGQKMT